MDLHIHVNVHCIAYFDNFDDPHTFVYHRCSIYRPLITDHVHSHCDIRREIDHHLRQASGECNAYSYLLQKLSVAVQCGVTA